MSCTRLPEPDVDEQPLLDALAARGVEARVAAWDDPDVDWSAAPLTVVRSAWNYADDRAGFLDWARRVASARTVLRNPHGVLAANTHKSYLASLERAELPTVPTRWFTHGGRAATPDAVSALPWRDVVVKPAIGGGSSGVRAFDLDSSEGVEQASNHITALQSVGDVLVQPKLASIADEGERDVVWIAGEITHVVTKLQRLEGEDERIAGARSATDAEATLAIRALRTLPAFSQRELLYARVDLALDELGDLRIVELEVTEPSLFLVQHEPALHRFADVLARESGAAAHAPLPA